jgi:hypothetical protein
MGHKLEPAENYLQEERLQEKLQKDMDKHVITKKKKIEVIEENLNEAMRYRTELYEK